MVTDPLPVEEDDGSTSLQDSILMLLEDAGIDTATNDLIMKLVWQGEAQACGDPVSRSLLPALREAADAIDFFDRVKTASDDEKIAVGSDHWNRLESATRGVAEAMKGSR